MASKKSACPERWTGCYGGGRGDLFTPESNRHPAKMAVGLCFRIFEHGRARGYWKPGDVILDPMCGIGTTLICGASMGFKTVGCELELHFIDLAEGNIELLMSKMPSAPRPVLLRGDARNLSAVLHGANGAVTSPPYAEAMQTGHAIDESKLSAVKEGKRKDGGANFQGRSPRSYSGVVTSPPYGDQVPSEPIAAWVLKVAKEDSMGEAVRRYRAEVMDKLPKHGRWSDANIQAHIEAALRIRAGGHYSGAISSPPYAGEPGHRDATPTGNSRLATEKRQPHCYTTDRQDRAQIGNLKDPRGDIDAVLSSPPYGDVMSTAEARGKPSSGWIEDKGIPHNKYGSDEAQIGNKNAETYLSAMLAVYRDLHAVLKPGGVVCLVTKNPVKAGKIRRLDDDTIRLMEAAGFELIERVQALLAEDLGEQMTLDGGAVKIRRERKSFFKRLFERKRPDLKVDHEDVTFFRRNDAKKD